MVTSLETEWLRIAGALHRIADAGARAEGGALREDFLATGQSEYVFNQLEIAKTLIDYVINRMRARANWLNECRQYERSLLDEAAAAEIPC